MKFFSASTSPQEMNTHSAFFEDEPAQLVPSGIFSGGDFVQHCSNNCDWTQTSSQSLNFSRIDDGQVPFFGHVAVPQFQSHVIGAGNHEMKPEPKSLIECLNYNSAPVSHNPPVFYVQQNACMVPMENQQKVVDYTIAANQIQILQSALEAEINDVQEACKILQIPSEPCLWTKADARAWLEWTCHQYNLTNCVDLRKFDCDGFELTMMDEVEFRERAPNCGDLLWSVLYIWKTSGGIKPEIDMGGYGCQPQQTRCQSISSGSEYSVASSSHQEFHGFGGFTVQTTSFSTVRPMSVFAASPAASTGADSGFDTEHISEDGDGHTEVDLDESMDGSGGHTQLWQFLKEMLSKPERYVSAIRWLDRSKGIFKIEDSVRVAKCWGKRKNRPAMNYDKLSRSIRQYYKKGIMKKTERSQRLVYQYCAAYAQ